MKELLDYIIPNIVNHPENVIIDENETPSGIVISIEVHPDDMGRVIGKSGKVIKAIRQIARIIAIKKGVKVHIDVVDKNNPNQSPGTEQAPANTNGENTEFVSNQTPIEDESPVKDTIPKPSESSQTPETPQK